MTPSDQYGPLIEKLEAAEVGSKDLDYEIWRAVTAVKPGAVEDWFPDFTHSMEDALDLAIEVFPDVFWTVARGKTRANEPLFGCILTFGTDDCLGAGEHDGSPAMAACIALLRALQSTPTDPIK